jgi:hypothetical protein
MKKLYFALFAALGLSIGAQAQVYCTPTLDCNAGDYIDMFTTTGGTTNINNTFTFCNPNAGSYIDYSATQILTTLLCASCAPGQTYQRIHAGSILSENVKIMR